MALFSLWRPGMSSPDLASATVEQGLLGKATAKRARDMVVEQFAPRYLADTGHSARNIKILIDAGLSLNKLKQIFLLHTTRANRVLHDYICEVYWPKYQAGRINISKDDAIEFLESAFALGKIPSRWSDLMVSRVASYLGGSLSDFGLLENGRKSSRRITNFKIEPLTSLYLSYDLHFTGYSDDNIPGYADWKLFGLDETDVIHELQRIAGDHFILQYSGELLRISWQYQTMEEALHAIATAEL